MIRAALASAALLAGSLPAAAVEGIPGPVVAEVVRVVDGDTIAVRADIWLGLSVSSLVRIRGIDTPEVRGECPEEKTMASAARDRLAALAGGSIRLANIAGDKYGGRVVADVIAADGTDLAAALVAAGLARPYAGGSRGGWCYTASVPAD